MPTLTNRTTGAVASLDEVIGYEAARPVDVAEHAVIGASVSDFTVRPARTRRGTFELLCRSRTAGVALEQFLTAPGPFTLTEATMPTTTFLVTGSVRLRFEGSRTALVSVEYTAVTS